MRRHRLFSALSLCVILAPAQALADELPRGAEARALFEEAVKLQREGKTSTACEKYAESYRVEGFSGTIFNLGDCYASVGKFASGYSCFAEAEEQYKNNGLPEKAQQSRTRADALVPHIPKLTIHVPSAVAATEGLVLRRNGDILRPAQWETPVFVDPGDVRVEASAPGRVPWTTVKKINEGRSYEVTVLPLDTWPMATRRKVALGLGGAGLAAVVVGSVFGALAKSEQTDVEAYCGPKFPECGQSTFFTHGQELAGKSKSDATISTVAFSLGLGALGTAIYLWVSAPPASDTKSASARAYRSDWVFFGLPPRPMKAL